jgi:hypothetical protein
MNRQTTKEIIEFLKSEVEPFDDSVYGTSYRASVLLTDDTFLPCVIFRNPQRLIDLAIRRFDEERKGKGIFSKSSGPGYSNIVKTFVTRGNCINDYDILKVEKSNFVLPKTILDEIQGETTMGWTGFAIKMKDGKHFSFGTSYHFDFFSMPNGYSPNDMVEVINHSYTTKEGELRQHPASFLDTPNDYDRTLIYRERPFFECYVDGL